MDCFDWRSAHRWDVPNGAVSQFDMGSRPVGLESFLRTVCRWRLLFCGPVSHASWKTRDRDKRRRLLIAIQPTTMHWSTCFLISRCSGRSQLSTSAHVPHLWPWATTYALGPCNPESRPFHSSFHVIASALLFHQRQLKVSRLTSIWSRPISHAISITISNIISNIISSAINPSNWSG